MKEILKVAVTVDISEHTGPFEQLWRVLLKVFRHDEGQQTWKLFVVLQHIPKPSSQN